MLVRLLMIEGGVDNIESSRMMGFTLYLESEFGKCLHGLPQMRRQGGNGVGVVYKVGDFSRAEISLVNWAVESGHIYCMRGRGDWLTFEE